jgi:phenylalanyl-tRNA synthetase alpha chain
VVRDDLERIEEQFAEALSSAAGDQRSIEAVRVRYLGRKGELTALMKQLGGLPAGERPAAGKAINDLKRRIEQEIERAVEQAALEGQRAEIVRDRVDISLPPRIPWSGSLHPVTHTRRELERIFREMGFTVEAGPEVEDDFHNFEALNLPPGHPARDETDTFYLDGGLLLRTHTSPVQIRTMQQRQPPIKMICPGRVYRRVADLKGTLSSVWKRFFGEQVEMRLRPGYFPFVEPGCEYDISCQVCAGKGCRVCKGSGWIELGGAGMVHPAVFEAVDVDPEHYSGFAFGLGIDRIAMMRHGIDDLRLLMENDSRFLRQFPI